MQCYVYANSCSSGSEQNKVLDNVRKVLEQKTSAIWREHRSDGDEHDLYDVPLSGLAFMDYIDDGVFGAIAKEFNCDVYW